MREACLREVIAERDTATLEDDRAGPLAARADDAYRVQLRASAGLMVPPSSPVEVHLSVRAATKLRGWSFSDVPDRRRALAEKGAARSQRLSVD